MTRTYTVSLYSMAFLWHLLLGNNALLPPSAADALTLSPLEGFLWKSRFTHIQQALSVQSPLLPPSGMPHVAYIFPGAGGRDVLTEELQDKLNLDPNVWATTVDWKEHCGSFVTAAYDSQAVGQGVADLWKTINSKDLPSSVHVIGISVGAFAANQFATELYCAPHKPHLRLTLLDPFCSRGIFGTNYGKTHFGLHADWSEQYLNTDDPVPTTNDPLPHCYCYDVTSAPQRDDFCLPEGESMHCWPVAYFSRFGYQKEQHKALQHDETRPRGRVVKL